MVLLWTKLNPIPPRMHCAKFGWNWPSGSGEVKYFNFINVFSLVRNYLPLEEGGAFYLNKVESASPMDALCQVWFKLALWLWRRRFVNSCFFASSQCPLFEQTCISFIRRWIVPSLIKIGSMVQEKNIFKFCQWIFAISKYLPWRRAGPFIWTNLNPLHPRMLCAKFSWNWLCGSGEEYF